MNESTEIAARNPYEIVERAKDKFIAIASRSETGIDYEKESIFAYQALKKNDFTLATAMKNPESVVNAVINIASVGLSLNPATSYAYLVPRDGAICLDISYQGLIKIATDSGSIMWAKADLVYAEDKFEYKGPAMVPNHTANPFGDRGDFVGVYCIAKTHDGDYLIETIAADEIIRIKDESASIKYARNDAARKSSPWIRYFGEMTKKACIKRASKTWPKTERHERIQKAIEVIHETEGSGWEPFSIEERKAFDDYVAEENGIELLKLQLADQEKYNALYRAAASDIPRGGKQKFKKSIDEMVQKVHVELLDCRDSITAALVEQDEGIVTDILQDLDEEETALVKSFLGSEELHQLENISA